MDYQSKIAYGYKQVFDGLKKFDSRLYMPQEAYQISVVLGLNTQCFEMMCTSVCQLISTNSKCVKDIRSVNKDWQGRVRWALVSELSAVQQFLSYVRNSPQEMSMEIYQTYLNSRLTIGAARYLTMQAKQQSTYNLGSDYGRIIQNHSWDITSDQINSICESFFIDKSTLPVIDSSGCCFTDPDVSYVLNCIKNNFPAFIYEPFDFKNTDYLPFSAGEFSYFIDLNGTPQTYLLDSFPEVSKLSCALNLLYGVVVNGNINPYGTSIYKIFSGKTPNFSEFKNLFVNVWTNLGSQENIPLYEGFTGSLHSYIDPVNNPSGGNGSSGPTSFGGASPVSADPFGDKKGPNKGPNSGGQPKGKTGPSGPGRLNSMISSAGNTAKSGLNVVNTIMSNPVLQDIFKDTVAQTVSRQFGNNNPIINLMTGKEYQPFKVVTPFATFEAPSDTLSKVKDSFQEKMGFLTNQ